MKELLGSDELNELLTAVSEGQVETAPAAGAAPQKVIRPFDFRSRGRLTPEQARTVQAVAEKAAAAISNSLGQTLRTPVETNLVAIEPATYQAFNSSLPDPVCLQLFRAEPGGHPGMFSLEVPLAFAFVDRLLGGGGQVLAQNKPLTEIEQAVITPLFHSICQRLGAAWADFAQVRFRPTEMAARPREVQSLPPQEPVLQITFTVSNEAAVGDMNICLPLGLINALVPPPYAASETADATQALRRAVAAAPLRLSVELGRAEITIHELLNLQPGQVIRLDTRPGRSLALAVEGQPYFAGEPGLSGNRRAVQITSTPKPPENGDNSNG